MIRQLLVEINIVNKLEILVKNNFDSKKLEEISCDDILNTLKSFGTECKEKKDSFVISSEDAESISKAFINYRNTIKY